MESRKVTARLSRRVLAALLRLPSRAITAKQLAFVGCLIAFSVAGCGGGGSGSLTLGAIATLRREGSAGKATAKAFKYKTSVTSVRAAGRNDLRGETLLGGAPKSDVAFYVTQRVTGVQADYSQWLPEPPDVYDTSGAQAIPLEAGSDLPKCVQTAPPAGFGSGQSFQTCDVFLLPPGDRIGKVVLAAEGPGQSDVTFKVG